MVTIGKYDDIIEEIRYYCEYKNYTQKELSEHFGIAGSTISYLKRKHDIKRRGMKNKFLIEDDFVKIVLDSKMHGTLYSIIDKSTFEWLKDFPVKWYAWNGIYVHCSIDDKLRKYLKEKLNYEVNIKKLRLHRLIIKAPNNHLVVDHINRNPLDNRLENLRLVEEKINAVNKKIPENNSSGCTGVFFHNQSQLWRARIQIDGKRIYLGGYKNKQDAIKARKKGEEKYWEDNWRYKEDG